MAFKILFATDMHFRASKPLSRLDKDFFGTILGKLDEVCAIAESEKVDIVLLGGDLFDREDAPHSVVIRVNRAFARFKMPVYTVIGNHEIYGYEGKTVDVSVIGSLFEMGAVKRLDSIRIIPQAMTDDQFDTEYTPVNIYGLHAFDKNEWTVPDSEEIKILVAHKLISPIKLHEDAGVIPITEVAAKTNADIVLSGDMHTPHYVKEGRTLFINPGSMARLSIEDRERQPQVAVISISNDGEITNEFKTLSTRPAETVFDTKAYANRMASKAHTDEFVKTYASAVISVKAEANKIGDVLIQFLEKNGVGDDIQKLIKGYLERAQREVLKEVRE